MLGTQTISFDMDDTLNWMSKELASEAGLTSIPKFDDIKKGNAPATFYDARDRLFPDPEFWANQPKTLLADVMIDIAIEFGFKPIICTKTPTSVKGMNLVAAAKVKWQQDHFPDVDMLIATGQKHANSNGLVDDSLKNCQVFNMHSDWYRPVLVWDNSRPNLDALSCFLHLADSFDIKHKYSLDPEHQGLTVIKAKDTGRIAIANRDTYDLGLPCGLVEEGELPVVSAVRGLYNETGISIPSGLEHVLTLKLLDIVVHCHYAEVESEFDQDSADWMFPQQFVACTSGEYRNFNTVLLYNLGLL